MTAKTSSLGRFILSIKNYQLNLVFPEKSLGGIFRDVLILIFI
jgi:hypothetical protein